uniref:Tubulin-specific chaperone cofactor E-like protein n=1 Tax=Crassostrea virginica TaxID=6565 RepID=A0A8B8BAC8_CRAVI|nr:tubulin-specific chaperone cofactor E-like protein [Crassostrea virginica]XP_022300380.1 tubulin-specific chaperone cofactor E-like protein [Crassostrea virginica]
MIRQRFKYFRTVHLKMEEESVERKNIAFSVMLPSKGRKRRTRKKSFTEAVKEKYCMSDPNKIYSSGFVIDIKVTGKPKMDDSGAELAYLRNVVLTNSSVGHAGVPTEGLSTLCPNVVDLDLSSNDLTDWKDMLTILSNLQCLKFVNLARNKLENKQRVIQSWATPLPQIENLVLNGTFTSWQDILDLTRLIPSLTELHACENEYENLDHPEDAFNFFQNINCLRLNNNRLRSWKEIWKLKHLPQLESLILSGNPIEQIFYKQEADCQLCRLNSAVGSERDVSMETENDVSMETERGISMEIQEMVEELVGDVLRRASRVRTEDVPDKTGCDQRIEEVPDNTRCDHSEPFSRLRLICLSKTQLDDWTHCSELRKYPALESLRIKDIPLEHELDPEEKRKLLVAHMPNIKTLNGSEVTSTERDKSERHFIRYFMDRADKPERFHELEAKHGKLPPLMDIDISGGYQEWINVTFIYNHRRIKEKVHVVDPIGTLRLMAAQKFCLYTSLRTFKLYHFACGPHHRKDEQTFEELIMQTQSLPISRFDIMDGDEIFVDP